MDRSLLKSLSIEEYYLKEVYSKGGKYVRGHPINDKLVLCPLHEDKNPSMGFLTGKDGIKRFHCFGCGRAGTVVDLHRGIKGLKDTEKALMEVCDILGVEYNPSENHSEGVFESRLGALRGFDGFGTQANVARLVRENKNKTKEILNSLLLGVNWRCSGE